MKRTSHAILGIAFLVSLALPAAVAAADPPLGGAVTLADGSVLPAMPAGPRHAVRAVGDAGSARWRDDRRRRPRWEVQRRQRRSAR